MSLIFFINGLSYLAVSLVAFYSYNSLRGEESKEKVSKAFGVMGVFYLLFAFSNFLWIFNFPERAGQDFILMNFVLAIAVSALLLFIVYKTTNNRNLIYLLLLFLTTLFAINLSLNSFFIFSMAVSYLLMMVIFMELLLHRSSLLKNAAIAGLHYTGLSLLFLAFAVGMVAYLKLPWFLPNVFLAVTMHFLRLKTQREEQLLTKKKISEGWELAVVYVKFLVFIIMLSSFILLSTIALHEMGHAMVSKYYGCEETTAIIYDEIGPRTEIVCDTYYNDIILTIAGLAATVAIALIFLITGGAFTTRLSYLILGFSILISYADLQELGLSKNTVSVLMLLSMVIIFIAIISLSKYYLSQQEVLKPKYNKSYKNERGRVEKIINT